jgi:hypothetical protein
MPAGAYAFEIGCYHEARGSHVSYDFSLLDPKTLKDALTGTEGNLPEQL